MRVVEWIGIIILLIPATLGLLFIRREIISHGGGTIEVSMRLSTMVDGRGWSSGVARFDGDELRWYRVFSFAPRPRRVLTRSGLAVESRRRPGGPERLALPPDWVILQCGSPRGTVEIAMAPATVTGFLSWLESAPPGAIAQRAAYS
jgi:hypothetical protein